MPRATPGQAEETIGTRIKVTNDDIVTKRGKLLPFQTDGTKRYLELVEEYATLHISGGGDLPMVAVTIQIMAQLTGRFITDYCPKTKTGMELSHKACRVKIGQAVRYRNSERCKKRRKKQAIEALRTGKIRQPGPLGVHYQFRHAPIPEAAYPPEVGKGRPLATASPPFVVPRANLQTTPLGKVAPLRGPPPRAPPNGLVTIPFAKMPPNRHVPPPALTATMSPNTLLTASRFPLRLGAAVSASPHADPKTTLKPPAREEQVKLKEAVLGQRELELQRRETQFEKLVIEHEATLGGVRNEPVVGRPSSGKPRLGAETGKHPFLAAGARLGLQERSPWHRSTQSHKTLRRQLGRRLSNPSVDFQPQKGITMDTVRRADSKVTDRRRGSASGTEPSENIRENLDDEDLGRRLLTVGNEKKTCRPPNDIQDGGKQENFVDEELGRRLLSQGGGGVDTKTRSRTDHTSGGQKEHLEDEDLGRLLLSRTKKPGLAISASDSKKSQERAMDAGGLNLKRLPGNRPRPAAATLSPAPGLPDSKSSNTTDTNSAGWASSGDRSSDSQLLLDTLLLKRCHAKVKAKPKDYFTSDGTISEADLRLLSMVAEYERKLERTARNMNSGKRKRASTSTIEEGKVPPRSP